MFDWWYLHVHLCVRGLTTHKFVTGAALSTKRKDLRHKRLGNRSGRRNLKQATTKEKNTITLLTMTTTLVPPPKSHTPLRITSATDEFTERLEMIHFLLLLSLHLPAHRIVFLALPSSSPFNKLQKNISSRAALHSLTKSPSSLRSGRLPSNDSCSHHVLRHETTVLKLFSK